MLAALLCVLLAVAPAAATQAPITGSVRDTSGGAIAGASVRLEAAGGHAQQTQTAADGRFRFDHPPSGPYQLIVSAPGFVDRHLAVAAGGPVDVVLTPAGPLETVTVTPTRTDTRLGSVPASVSVLTRQDIEASPAVAADDVLRQLPEFSLFRRSSSLVSHPTTQGVSLRGIGPSGVSRTLVLLDGIPFNDPFGGWVYWTRVPLDSLQQIEVVDSPSSSLYGNYAMGGVIDLVTRPATPRTFEVRSQYGNYGSPELDLLGSSVRGRFGVLASGRLFRTGGYPVVAPSERGKVDNNAAVAFGQGDVKLDFNPTDNVRMFARGGYFGENRQNGKASTINGAEEANDTRWASGSGGLQAHLPDGSDLQASLFGGAERFHSTFLAVPPATPPRSIGRMSLDQHVPATYTGGSVQWSKTLGTAQVLTAGADWNWVQGNSHEDVLDSTTGTHVILQRISGGTQRNVGAFVEDVLTPIPRLTVTASARLDHWRKYDAHNLETVVATGRPSAANAPVLPEGRDTVASPRIAAMFRAGDRVSIWGDLGTGFRAPTLNELYRQFRVGTVLTLPNDTLGPERLVGGEVGVNVQPIRNLTWRTTWFDDRIHDAVANITIATTPSLITRQRQNVGRTRVWGVQTDVEYRLGPSWTLSAGYLFEHARVTDFAPDPSLVGKYLPEVPTNRASARAIYANPRFLTFGAGVQVVGRQFDDDQNVVTVPGQQQPGLPAYAVVNLTASRRVRPGFDVFAGVQNLFDHEYFVGTLPTTIGSPRLISAGVQMRIGR
ncbi:MAG: TonB-dependent receptor [Acidobacteriota bacterium]|nr:TonB-dependent receptor [Acidobacteriota bacterium]